jgi:hypothetical protein
MVGAVLSEALGAITALQEERIALCDIGQGTLELVRLTGEDQRRERFKPGFDRGERGIVRILWHLDDRL